MLRRLPFRIITGCFFFMFTGSIKLLSLFSFPIPVFSYVDDAALLDHNDCHLLPNDKGTQTDFPYKDLEVLTSEIDTLKQENGCLET